MHQMISDVGRIVLFLSRDQFPVFFGGEIWNYRVFADLQPALHSKREEPEANTLASATARRVLSELGCRHTVIFSGDDLLPVNGQRWVFVRSKRLTKLETS
jgi:hypothetical protein